MQLKIISTSSILSPFFLSRKLKFRLLPGRFGL
jgi:hypothetical protein